MRLLSMFLAGALLLGVLGCNSGSNASPPTSQLVIFDAETNGQLAIGDQRGTLAMQVGSTRKVRVVERNFPGGSGTGFTDVDITQDVDINVQDADVVTVADQDDAGLAGTITAVAVGTTQIEFRNRRNDITADDFAYLDVTVIPAD